MDNEYALAQWRQALLTAATTSDDATRRGAQRRMSQWERVIAGLRSGSLRLGSRTPVHGLPAWVTPDVVRGGFATGRPAASGPLSDFERQLAREAGLHEERGAVFEHALTEHGMLHLWAVLDSGRFDIDLPEAAALLLVAWLVREGEVDSALDVVDELRPLARTVRFLPASVSPLERDPEVMWREDAGTVAAALRTKRVPPQVLTMNGVLDVWNPFADKLLGHWLGVMTDGHVDEPFSSEWLDAGRELLAEFDRLAAEHAPPRRHTSPKENAAALRMALAAAVGGQGLRPRDRGRVRHAVDAMVRRRGAPESSELRELRERQGAQAARPTVASLAHLAAGRLASTPADAGIEDVEAFAAPVTAAEAAPRLPAGTPMPRTVERALLRAKSGTLPELVQSRVITSAELLAMMVPQVTAQIVAEQYDDPVLRVLMARSYEAFRRRRSLLLLDLQHQVQPEELPWVAAAGAHQRQETSATRDVARETLLRLADEAITHWPGAILPNPLVAELGTLATAADLSVPLLEEIAADIFMGRFATKYVAGFELAASSLGGTLYARYYQMPDHALTRVRRAAQPAQAFGDLCSERARAPEHRWCAVCNGMLVEQSQILTTHNLASLTAIGFAPSGGWRHAADGAYTHAASLLTRLNGNRRPQRMLKDLSYAWRQMVFYVAQLDERDQAAFLDQTRDDAVGRSAFARDRLVVLLDDLARPGTRPPLLGWGHGRHWLLEARSETA